MKQNGKRITINQIAEYLNLSKTTISNYLNGNFNTMSLETKKRIQAAIDELGYHPSYFARTLKSNRNKTIGVIFSHFAGADTAAYLTGLYDVCHSAGYNVILFNSFSDPAVEIRNLESCVEQAVDGIIIRTCCTDLSFHNKICDNGIPIVFVDRYSSDWKHDAVYIDQEGIVTEALEHMWLNGFRKIFLISSSFSGLDVKARRVEAFRKFIEIRLGEDADKYIFITDNAPGEVAGLIKEIRRGFPDERKALLVCGNSRVVWQVAYEFRAQDIKTPVDLGLCMFDSEWQWCKLVGTGITAIYQPCSHMAQMAASNLLLRINGHLKNEPQIQVLKASLFVGSSTQSII